MARQSHRQTGTTQATLQAWISVDAACAMNAVRKVPLWFCDVGGLWLARLRMHEQQCPWCSTACGGGFVMVTR